MGACPRLSVLGHTSEGSRVPGAISDPDPWGGPCPPALTWWASLLPSQKTLKYRPPARVWRGQAPAQENGGCSWPEAFHGLELGVGMGRIVLI